MESFKRKLRLYKRIRNCSAVITFILLLVAVASASKTLLFALFSIVLFTLILIFIYELRFGKAEKFIEKSQMIIDDNGYYLTARAEKEREPFLEAVKTELKNSWFKLSESEEFDFIALKGREYIYGISAESVNSDSILKYLSSTENDLISSRHKLSGEAVVFVICDRADESAVNLSKNYIRRVSKRNKTLIISPAIIEVKTGKVYFLGNRISSAQKNVCEFLINSELPLDDKYIVKDKLEFQKELENKLKDFNLNYFRLGKYNDYYER